MYRDASNYKSHGGVVFEGLPGADSEDKIKAALESSCYFIASQVDVPDLFLFLDQYDYDEQDDHCWHEYIGLEPTDMEVTDERQRSISEFVAELCKIGPSGWKEFNPDPWGNNNKIKI